MLGRSPLDRQRVVAIHASVVAGHQLRVLLIGPGEPITLAVSTSE
jgi:hypothetical protein